MRLTANEDGQGTYSLAVHADGWERNVGAGLGPVELLAEIADTFRRRHGSDPGQLLAAAIGQHVCSECSALLAYVPEGGGGWHWAHRDASEAAWCADFRGDRRPLALLASEACAGEPTYPQLDTGA